LPPLSTTPETEWNERLYFALLKLCFNATSSSLVVVVVVARSPVRSSSLWKGKNLLFALPFETLLCACLLACLVAVSEAMYTATEFTSSYCTTTTTTHHHKKRDLEEAFTLMSVQTRIVYSLSFVLTAATAAASHTITQYNIYGTGRQAEALL